MAEGRFPIIRTTGTLPGRAPGVRARLDVSTDGTGRAISALGGAISAVGNKWDVMEADSQFTTSKRLAKEELNRLELSLEGNIDTESYAGELTGAIGVIKGLSPKNKLAATEHDKWIQSNTPAWQLGVEQSRRSMVEQNWEDEAFAQLGAGDIAGYRIQVQKGRQAGFIDEEEKLQMLRAANVQGLKVEEKKVFDLAMALPEKDGIALINASGLPLNSIKSIRAEYTTQKSIQRNSAERETGRIQDEIRQNFIDRITANEDKNQIRGDMLLARADGTLTESAFGSLSAITSSNVIDIGDPRTELEMSQKVRVRPETITKEEIYKPVGKGAEGGLSLAFANTLADKWQTWKNSTVGAKPKDPKVSSFAKRGHGVIDELEELGKRYGLKGAKSEEDWETTEDIAQFYNILNEYHDALDAFMDTEPAPPQVREFVDNLLIAEKQGQAESAVRRWWRGHMPDYLGGKAGGTSNWIAEPGTQFPRPKSEREFNAKVADIEDEAEARAYYNLWVGDFE